MADKRPSITYRDEFLAALPQGGLCVEVGSFDGAFAEQIYAIVKPEFLVLIDEWATYWDREGDEVFCTVQERFAAYPNVALWRGRSCEMIPALPNRGVAFAYIDADHSYEAVLADLEAMLPKMQSGGWLCGHDYCAIEDYGVVRAVAVFLDRHDLSLALLTDEPLLQQTPSVRSARVHWNEWDAVNSFGIRIP